MTHQPPRSIRDPLAAFPEKPEKEWPIIDIDSIPCTEISDTAVLAKSPLVSVRMSTYNHAPYIAKAIEGVLTQRVQFPMELVIGEDCSTDATRQIVMRYQKRHPDIIRVVTSNGNVGSRRNGLRAHRVCRGKYNALCEGDDYWHDQTKLQRQVDTLETNPEIGFVHSDVNILNLNTRKRTERAHRVAGCMHDDTPEQLFLQILTGKYKIWTCTICTRSSLVNQILAENRLEFQTDRFLLGDTSLWMELSKRTRFHYIDEPLATIHALPESASRSRDAARQLRFLISCHDVRTHYVKKFLPDEAAQRRAFCACAHLDWALLHCAFRGGDVATARSILDMLAEERGSTRLRERFLCWGTTSPFAHWMVSLSLQAFRTIRYAARTLTSRLRHGRHNTTRREMTW